MNREKIHVIKTNYKILINSQYHFSSVYIVLVKTGEENVNDVMREEKIFQIQSQQGSGATTTKKLIST